MDANIPNISIIICSNCDDLKDYHNVSYKDAMGIICFDEHKDKLIEEGVKIDIKPDNFVKNCYSCR